MRPFRHTPCRATREREWGSMSRSAIDLIGQRFGRLLVLERAGNDSGGRALWKCRCDCGKVTVARGNDLRNGHTQSCGCKNAEESRIRERETHTTHGGSETRLYRIWRGMKTRCYVPSSSGYAYYGGRGIAVCEEWIDDFTAFRDWALANGYADNLSIDRIDNEKGYSTENCRWVTSYEQMHNRRCDNI